MKELTPLPTRWNLSSLFSSDNDPRMEKERQAIAKRARAFINRWKDRTDFIEDPVVLKEALEQYEDWARSGGGGGRQGYYLGLRLAQEEDNPLLKAKANQLKDFAVKLVNEMQFFELRLARMPKERQSLFLNYPPLKPYRHWLERLFAEAPYLLSEPEERILNLKSGVSYGHWVRFTSEQLAKEEEIIVDERGRQTVKSFHSIVSFLSSTNSKTRSSAAAAVNRVLKAKSEIAEAELNSVLEDKKINDELRKMPRPDLSRHIADDLESKVVDALVKAVSARFNLARRFYRLKAKLMGVKQLEYHERNVPWGKFSRTYTYRQAANIVYRTLGSVDREFGEIFRRFATNGQIDVYPRRGRAGGGFCAGDADNNFPTVILLNFTGRIDDVLTLAHEAGHGINNELMKKQLNALAWGAPISMAEVASTFMEECVLESLYNDLGDDADRLSLLIRWLDDSVSTIFRQIAAYRFEQELHRVFRQVGYLTGREIGQLFTKHMRDYMGPAVRQSPGSENWWIYWSHFRSYFYVYSYASGILVAKSLKGAANQDPAFIHRLKQFLAAGSSASPRELLERLDINISDSAFWDRGLDQFAAALKTAEKLAWRVSRH